jgi:hypothetical protein
MCSATSSHLCGVDIDHHSTQIEKVEEEPEGPTKKKPTKLAIGMLADILLVVP